jgi:hypothetical protein
MSKFKGTWGRVYGTESLEFSEDGTIRRKLRGDDNSFGSGYLSIYDVIDENRIKIGWSPSLKRPNLETIGTIRLLRPGETPLPSKPHSMWEYNENTRTYSYEFKEDNTLTLTDETGKQYLYIREPEAASVQPQVGTSIGPEPVIVSGQLVGPDGVLANQKITLSHYCPPPPTPTPASTPAAATPTPLPIPTIPRAATQACEAKDIGTTTTDASGHYTFPEVAPGGEYQLTFWFNRDEAITQGQPIEVDLGDFILRKPRIGSMPNPRYTYSAVGKPFSVTGFEPVVKNFIYPK